MKSVLVGAVAVVLTVALLTYGLAATMHIDARWLMGQYLWFSVPSILIVFALAFRWQFRRGLI
jgi:uncharacterized membrane protein